MLRGAPPCNGRSGLAGLEPRVLHSHRPIAVPSPPRSPAGRARLEGYPGGPRYRDAGGSHIGGYGSGGERLGRGWRPGVDSLAAFDMLALPIHSVGKFQTVNPSYFKGVF